MCLTQVSSFPDGARKTMFSRKKKDFYKRVGHLKGRSYKISALYKNFKNINDVGNSECCIVCKVVELSGGIHNANNTFVIVPHFPQELNCCFIWYKNQLT